MSVAAEALPVQTAQPSLTRSPPGDSPNAELIPPKFDEKASPKTTVPEVNVNGEPIQSPRPSTSSPLTTSDEETVWGSNFWVTLVDPQTSAIFFACPATGQVSWDPPVGTFVLPPNAEGEWWELSDESRGGIPYYYQTKSGETVWERPNGFVIPLGIIQQTALGRRLSQTGMRGKKQSLSAESPDKPSFRRSRSYTNEKAACVARLGDPEPLQSRLSQSSTRSSPGRIADNNNNSSPAGKKSLSSGVRRSLTTDQYGSPTSPRAWPNGHQLPPIPASPHGSHISSSRKSMSTTPAKGTSSSKEKGKYLRTTISDNEDPTISRARAKSSPYVSHKPPTPQSLSAAVELFAISEKRAASDSGHGGPSPSLAHSKSMNVTEPRVSINPSSPTKDKPRHKPEVPPSPRKSMNPGSAGGFWSARSTSAPTIAGKEIGNPVLNQEATITMSPLKNRTAGKPILVENSTKHTPSSMAPLTSGTHPVLPQDLASDIQQFVESEYARQYFSIHRTGFIFRRKVPVTQMMTWQKTPLTSPLLTLNRSLRQDAVKIFRVIQHIMGDRERDRSIALRVHSDNHMSPMTNGSTGSLVVGAVGLLEEERWLLSEGLTHGELRDEIYCQLMKQLNGNPNPESVFKGWQMLCVLLIAFPSSKNFETYLRSFIQQRVHQQEGRVDVMAKHCLRRLTAISKKGPRGKAPTIAEIETASDAAFNPSTFGESLDATIRLQERNYPHEKVPIVLPFLADGILALGRTKAEGIFRVPGDSDCVSELKLRIDRGYYTLDGVDDPHVLASLLKLWLRELCDPLVPEEMYNDCITQSKEPEACIALVHRLPTVNRRIVLFIVSFLQLFLDDKIQAVTKMTPANLALVMAPNLLRCNSDSMSVVFTNAHYEQIFVHNLLLHLKCNELDPDYIPTHGLGANPPSTPHARTSKSRTRR